MRSRWMPPGTDSMNDAFLRAIVADPADDATRLVYADFLEDHGDAVRAEFIRTQIALTRMAAEDPARPALAARETALLQEHGQRWAEPLRGLNWKWRFGRGFIEGLQIPFFNSEAVPVLEHVVALAPVQVLSTDDDSPEGEALVAAAPSFKHLRELRFEYTAFHYPGGL